jgi:NhaP-type Na+/H+ or K+/H+ antiporter
MSDETRQHLDDFWELIDESLNAVLFVLIGLEVLVIPLHWSYAIAGLAAIPITLAARWISVAGVMGILRLGRPIAPGTISILTWGGLRGGISVALALSLPPMSDRNQFSITVTFVLIAVLLWMLSNMTRTTPREARPLVVTFLIAQLFYVLISWEYFFAGPGVVGGVMAACMAAAAIGLYRLDQSQAATRQLVNA